MQISLEGGFTIYLASKETTHNCRMYIICIGCSAMTLTGATVVTQSCRDLYPLVRPYLFFFFLVWGTVLRFEFRAFLLLGKHSTAGTMPPDLFCSGYLLLEYPFLSRPAKITSLLFYASCQAERCMPQCPSSFYPGCPQTAIF
jgi:hypothetical protein